MKTLLVIGITVLLTLDVVTSMAVAAGQKGPHQVVRESTRQVLAMVEEHKARHGEKVTDRMVQAMIGILEPVVDFPAIARSVMGKHATIASDEQVERFTLTFRDALATLYMKSFVTFELEEIIVLDPAPDFDPDSGRTSVRMQAVGTDGSRYEIRYSMRTNNRGAWKMRNVIIEGINVGLTFLNQFDGAMARHGNDIEKVINNWGAEMNNP